MYIRKVTINNITSLKGEHVIDFTQEPLRSADLFAITGDTGAGKSTILDSICLALYNRAPRFAVRERSANAATAGQNANSQLQGYDTRNALRRGENEGSCAVEFHTQEGIFVATWSVRVKRTGTFDSVSRSLVQMSPKKKTFDPREVQENILRLVGLDYEQFTRTVILAQNSFANFLRARRDEKSKLLEKITGTEIYNRISTVVFEQNRVAQKDFREKQIECEFYRKEVLDEASLKECENRKNLVESQMAHLAERVEYLKKQLAWYDTYDELEAKNRAATEAYNNANRVNVSMTRKRERLQRYDDVAEIRDKVVSVQNDEAKIAAAQKNIDALAKEESERNREKSEAASLLEGFRAEYAKCENSRRQLEPMFRKAHEVLGKIAICESNRKEKTSDLEKHRKDAAEIEAKIKSCEAALKSNEEKLVNSKNTLQSLLPHQPMFDQYGSVLEKIRSYGSLMSDSDAMKKRQDAINAELENLKNAVEKIEGEMDSLMQKKETLEQNRTQLQNSILGVDSNILQRNYNEAFTLRANLQGARRLWDSLAAEYAEYEKNEGLISGISITIETRKGLLHDLELETTKFKQIYEIHEKYFNMGQADNVKEMRRNLHEGEPCPVCGATHHPYHSESEQRLDEVVSNAERARDEAREKYNASEEKFGNLKTMQSSDAEKYRSLIEKREEISRRIERDRKEWQQYSQLDKTFADCSGKVNAGARRVMIIQLWENADKTVGDTQKKLEEYGRCHSEIERCTAEIEKTTNTLSELQKKRSGLLMNKGVNEGNLATIAENLHVNSDNAHEIYLDLEKLLTVADWRTLIRSDQKMLRDKITAFYNRWKECNANMQRFEESKEEIETDKKMLESSRQKNNNAIQEITARLEELDNMISSSRNDIYRMFGDDDPLKTEQDMKLQLERARNAVDEKQEAFHRAEQALGAISAQCALANDERRRLEKERLEISTQIDTWISAFNQNHSSVQYNELVEIFGSDCDWKAMRTELKKVENDFVLAGDRMLAAQAALNNWQTRPEHPDRTVETRQYISSSIDTISLKQKGTNAELDEVKRRLASHKENSGKLDRLEPVLRELQKNASEWEKLNTLVGSANGMVFSRIAQNTTLHLLVEHANAQLALFSPRYRLRKTEDTLDLEITDLYMNEEHRPVASLSGGETFVVSLALALGLASLSNCRLSIGSLFIDEGFGNLDSESLDMVIRALGSLNAQGRKVGIISHTQQIRENIFPQIQVVRKNTSDSLSVIRVASF